MTMRFRDPREERGPGPPAGQPVEGDRERQRREAEELLAASDAAIARALSGDSEAFLRANRQQGGQ